MNDVDNDAVNNVVHVSNDMLVGCSDLERNVEAEDEDSQLMRTRVITVSRRRYVCLAYFVIIVGLGSNFVRFLGLIPVPDADHPADHERL